MLVFKKVLTHSLISLHAFILFLFLCAFLALWVPSDQAWWIQVLGIFLPPFTIALGATSLILLAFRKKIWAWIGIWGVLVFLLRDVVVWGFPPAQEAIDPKEVLALATYNVSDQIGIRDSAAIWLKPMKFDAIFFQEVSLWRNGHPDSTYKYYEQAIRPLVKTGKYRLNEFYAFNSKKVSFLNQPVLISKSIQQGRLHPFLFSPLIYPSLINPMNIASRIPIDWNGKQVVLYNIHLESFGAEKPWHEWNKMGLIEFILFFSKRYAEAYGKQAHQVRAIRAMMNLEKDPVILAGDFNNTPYNWAYGQLSAGMQDTFKQAGQGFGPTYHALSPWVRIDFILASPHFEILSSERPNVKFSDHYPVFAKLRLKTG